MNPNSKRRIMALVGVIALLVFFILTVVFLIIGNMPMAVTMVALNGLLLFIIYLVTRVDRNVKDVNPELFQDDEEDK